MPACIGCKSCRSASRRRCAGFCHRPSTITLRGLMAGTPSCWGAGIAGSMLLLSCRGCCCVLCQGGSEFLLEPGLNWHIRGAVMLACLLLLDPLRPSKHSTCVIGQCWPVTDLLVLCMFAGGVKAVYTLGLPGWRRCCCLWCLRCRLRPMWPALARSAGCRVLSLSCRCWCWCWGAAE